LAIFRALVAGVRDYLRRSAKSAKPSPTKEAWPETKQTGNAHPVEECEAQQDAEKLQRELCNQRGAREQFEDQLPKNV